jgi:hypothetical protein
VPGVVGDVGEAALDAAARSSIGFWRRIVALFLGRYGVQTGYMVTVLDAVNVLQTKDPATAAWWCEHCGHLLDGKRQFLFPTASCQERP